MIRSICIAVVLLVASLASTASAKTTLKMATLAPERSPWGKVFQLWSKSIAQSTQGQVDVVWLWNGNAGPEVTALGKIKTGQLAGAAVSGTGLGTLHKPIVALQMPGMFGSWSELDRARAKLESEFAQAVEAQGILIGGFSDVGTARIMSNGFAVRGPADLRGKHPGYLRESLIAPKVFGAIGGITPRPGAAGEVLGLLSSGAVDVLISTPLAAEQLQWVSRLSHMNTMPVGFGVGAIVLGKRQVEALTPDEREVVLRSARRAGEALSKRIRKYDDDALARLRRRLQPHDVTAAESAEWKRVFNKACKELEKALPGDAIARIGGCR
jgi:TRAP-type transport system periplasmic protein